MRFRRRAKLFPGVYLNFSNTGISTTIGVRGASVNFNKQGAFLNTGIPGTGIYDRQKIGGGKNPQNIPVADTNTPTESYSNEEIGTINGQSFGPKNKIEVLSPRYPNSIINEDGTDNSGSMFEEVAAIAGKAKNTLRWHTRQTDIQDFDVVIRHTLPANFAGFQGANPLSLEFMTEGTFSDSKIDIVIEKEGSTIDELQGTGIGFNSNSWTTVDLNLNPTTTWNPNDTLIIKMKMYSRNNIQSYVSDIVLKYIEN